mmetsp:Transcript_130080/g.324278  ORF Transcript_130080/g.324278 Transcript_130080/m.324278 type:complete len:575 (+) Transcript_130080:137-1861(+)
MPLLSLAASAAWICDAPKAASAATAAASAVFVSTALCRCRGNDSSLAPSTLAHGQPLCSRGPENVQDDVAGSKPASDAEAKETVFADTRYSSESPSMICSEGPDKAEDSVAVAVAKICNEAMDVDNDAVAAASEVVAHVASMRQMPELLTAKVCVAFDASGSMPLRSRWIALQGDLLWILQMRASDYAGKQARTTDLPRLAEHTVHIQGAKLVSEPTKSGGQITLSGIKSPWVQCLRLQVNGKEAAQKLECALRDAVGRHQLPEALDQALVRATSAPPRRPRCPPQQAPACGGDAESLMEPKPSIACKSPVARVSSLRSSLDAKARPLTPRGSLAATVPLALGSSRQTPDPLVPFGTWAAMPPPPTSSRVSSKQGLSIAGGTTPPRFSTASAMSRSVGSYTSGTSLKVRDPFASAFPYLAQELGTAELQVKQLTELWQKQDARVQARRDAAAAAATASTGRMSPSSRKPASAVGSPGSSASPASHGSTASPAAAKPAAASVGRLAASTTGMPQTDVPDISEVYRVFASPGCPPPSTGLSMRSPLGASHFDAVIRAPSPLMVVPNKGGIDRDSVR